MSHAPTHRAEPSTDVETARTSRLRWLLPAVLLVVWLAVGAIGGPFQGRLAEVQENDSAAFLPDGVESSEAQALADGFRDDSTIPAFLVVETDDGSALSEEQLGRVADFVGEVPDVPVQVGEDGDGFSDVVVGDFLALEEQGPPAPGGGPLPVLPSEDGQAALVLLPFDASAVEEPLADGETALVVVVQSLRDADDALTDVGLVAYLAGPAGTVADFGEAFGEIDGILLGVALVAVLVILLLVYRSPALPFLVISSAVFALAGASVVVYLLASNGLVDLNGQSQGILFILVVGAATDYALLLVARYREELRRHADRWTAMRVAWRRAVEPVVASGSTVILGLLCLLLSDLGSNRGLGPIASVGIVMAMLSALTFLPALLLLPAPLLLLLGLGAGAGAGALVASLAGGGSAAITGAAGAGALLALAVAVLVLLRLRRRAERRRAAGEVEGAGRWVFWPAEPGLGEVGSEGRGVWARLAALVGRRPRRVWVATALGLGLFAAFLPLLDADGVAQSDVFLVETESVLGAEVLAEHFPAGSDAPSLVVVPEADADAVLQVLADEPGVASADVAREPGQGPEAPGDPLVVDGLVLVEAVLADPADSLEAQETVERLRSDLDAATDEALVGGQTAQQLDVIDVSTRDLFVIIPVVLVVIFVVLALLLRSIVAPALILAANILSFGATLGVSALVFRYLLGYPGADPAVPLFGFVFLVALGIDYSIFLMTRVREESQRIGTRPGILLGLSVTGGVITSAGVVLAATFAALFVLPLLFLAQIAFIVAFGVLLDTFVVRSLLVPALGYDIGRRIWWPHPMSRADAPGEQVAEGSGRHVDEREPEPVA